MTWRRAGLLTRNLMDRSKIEKGLEGAGWEVVLLKDRGIPMSLDLIFVDLEHPAAFAIIEEAASTASVRCLAYGPHVRVEAFDRAKQLGAEKNRMVGEALGAAKRSHS